MKIDKNLINKIANLAKLEFDEKSLKEMQKDMTKILSYVKKVKELNTENIKPLITPIEESLKLRKDDTEKGLTKEEVLKNAPAKNSDYLKVPKFIKK
tara:strand:- start:240 stop:530 length:291 start_codon:yes stop_codon:yes gene_type:complete